MEPIDWSDVQGFIRRGMGWLNMSAYVLLEITDGAKARTWLKGLPVTSATDIEDRGAVPEAVNIAFTFPGLCQLGFDPSSLAGFSREFFEGMAPRNSNTGVQLRRSGMLGDVGPNDPHEWRWGGLKDRTRPVHAVLLIFGTSDPSDRARDLSGPEDVTGLRIIETLPGWLPADQREHFNFRDGISQPIIAGDAVGEPDAASTALHLTAAGEFLIGYRNERGNLPVSPRMPDGRDFGRNGSYFVLRELEQDVPRFEAWLDDKAAEQSESDRARYREWLAAKMIGRWRNGAPLTRFPDRDDFSEEFGRYDDKNVNQGNSFYYHAEDRDGFRCPIGAHIRRAWPRDALGDNPARALQQARLHRILRRGRLFGPAYDRNAKYSRQESVPRGLYFGCFNADISGQFETVQHNWINTPNFSGLANERDPLVGERGAENCMTIQYSPVNFRLRGLSAFVKTCGGAYFFMPGLAAVRRLADL